MAYFRIIFVNALLIVFKLWILALYILKYQKNYSVVEKETLGLVLALDKFDVYLGSMPFRIKAYTDHNPITLLKTMKNKNQRLFRWSLALQKYDLEIQHISGSENVAADAYLDVSNKTC